MRNRLCILLLLPIFVACNNTQRPERRPLADTTFGKAYSTQYGQHYLSRGVRQNVIDLDLYSENLSLDSLHHIVGTGTNLYLSDIFLPEGEDTLLAGTFVSDTTAAEYTFLPGVDYDSNISGAYLLNITDGNLTSYTIFTEGSFIVNREADSTHIHFTLKYTQGNVPLTYEADFHGVIDYEKQ